MDTSITFHLQVEEKNIKEGIDSLNISEYPINLTLKHSIEDIKQSIWRKSHDYSLKPIFLSIAYEDRVVSNNEKICDIINTNDPPEEGSPIYKSFDLIIDYTLFDNRAIPMREPDIELFEVIIEAQVEGGNSKLSLRESLDCTLGTIKDCFIEYGNKYQNEAINRRDVKVELRLSEEETIIFDDDVQKFRDILRLDVVPLKTVIFLVSMKPIVSGETLNNRQYRRFHIKIESNVTSLQEGSNLFEVNRETELQEFKHQIIDRIDYLSVARTFFDQIELYFQTQLIPNTNDFNKKALFDLLLLNDTILRENNGIITMHLIISNKYGGGRVLSQDFWRDLLSDDRFEFSPDSNNDLPNSNNDLPNLNEPQNPIYPPRPPHNFNTNTIANTNTNTNTNNEEQEEVQQVHQENMVGVQPTRLILRDGAEWSLSGESYEMLSLNETSATAVNGPRALLVNQMDLSPIHYEISAEIDGEPKTTTLNTSQCIIVDNGTHRPYMLINQTGTSLLDSAFRRSNGDIVLQQSYVELFNPQNTPDLNNEGEYQAQNIQNPAQQNELREIEFPLLNRLVEFARANFPRGLHILIRTSFVVYILGLHRPFMIFWKQILILFSICVLSFSILFAGDRVGDVIVQVLLRGNERPGNWNQRMLLNTAQFLRFVSRNTTNVLTYIRTKLIMYTVTRPRDYEYLLERRTAFHVLLNNFSNIPRDFVLIILTIIPSFHPYIHEELETWRDNELADLRAEVNKLYELVLGRISMYNLKNDDPFVIPNDTHFSELEEKFNAEDQSTWESYYKDMIEFYKMLQETNVKLG